MSQTMNMNNHNGYDIFPKSAMFMELANIDHTMDWSDFDDIVKFLETNLDTVIEEVHHYGSDKMLMQDAKTKLFCPPNPDLHHTVDKGVLILEAHSEKVDTKRDITVLDLGIDPENEENHLIEIHEDIVKAPTTSTSEPTQSENVVTVSMCRKEHKPKYFQGN
jgi:hypothetical protein